MMNGWSHCKFPLKAFISVAMHLPHMGREHLLGYSVGLINKRIFIFIICDVTICSINFLKWLINQVYRWSFNWVWNIVVT